MKDTVKELIVEFFDNKVKRVMQEQFLQIREYIIDAYIERKEGGTKYKTWLIDVNPWIPVCTDSLLFSWEELEGWKETDPM